MSRARPQATGGKKNRRTVLRLLSVAISGAAGGLLHTGGGHEKKGWSGGGILLVCARSFAMAQRPHKGETWGRKPLYFSSPLRGGQICSRRLSKVYTGGKRTRKDGRAGLGGWPHWGKDSVWQTRPSAWGWENRYLARSLEGRKEPALLERDEERSTRSADTASL